jgi:hypothetical protein
MFAASASGRSRGKNVLIVRPDLANNRE